MLIGDIVANRYKLIREISKSGASVVFETMDLKRQETVAVKFFLSDSKRSSEMIGRFLREIKAILEIKNDNVARIHTMGVVESIHYISMEYIEGYNIREKLARSGIFSIDETLQILAQVCRGLSAIHHKKIIHRDITAKNIVITAGGIAKIIDFGIARTAIQQSDTVDPTSSITRESKLVGTPEYMSPEQALARPLDYRTDIYSLGIVMYEMITGKLPFSSDNSREVLNKQVKEVPRFPTALNPSIPEHLETIVIKALSKKPEDRQQSADELLDELNAVKGLSSVSHVAVSDSVTIQDDDSIIGVLDIDDELVEMVATTGPQEPEVDSVEELFQKGMDCFHRREFSKALDFFEQVVKLNPQHPMAYNYVEIAGEQISKEATIARILAECNRALKARQFQKAKTLIDEALVVGPENPMVQVTNKKVTALLEKEQRQTAESGVGAMVSPSIQSSAAPTPQPAAGAAITFELGKQLYEEKRYDEALAIFQELTDKKVNHPLLFDYYEMTKAAKAAREDIEHHFLTARRLVEEGDLNAARQELHITLDFDPDYEEAKKLLEKISKTSSGSASSELKDTSTDEIARKTGMDPAYIKALQAAQGALKQQQFEEALAILSKVGQAFPDKVTEVNGYIKKIQQGEHRFFISEHMKRGRQFMQERKYHQASTAFSKIIEREPDNPQANDLIKQCRDKLNAERVRQEVSTKMHLQSKDIQSDTTIASKPRINRKVIVGLLIALAVVVGGVTQYPLFIQKLGEYFRARGMIELNSGSFDDAVTYLQRAYDFTGDTSIRESLAQAFFQNGTYEQAKRIFNDLLNEGGNKSQCYYYLGLIADKLNDEKNAKESLKAAIKADPRLYPAHNALGAILIKENQLDLAIQSLNKSLAIKPLQPQIQLDLARLYQASGQSEAALGIYNLMIKDNPAFTDAYTEMGKLNIGLGRYQAAIAILSRHPHFTTGDAALYYTLGDVNEKLAKGKQGSDWRNAMIEAKNFFQKCYTINPQHDDVVKRLAATLRALGDNDSLIAMFVMYLRDFPDDFAIHIELGTIYQKKRMYPNAQTHFEHATRIDPRSVDAWNHLGNIFVLRGNKRDARSAFRKSLEIKPGQSAIRRKLRSLK